MHLLLMAKLNIGLKEGKSTAIEADVGIFVGKKIGDKVHGNTIDLDGYEFEITGGSDIAGFPMRKGIQGTGRKDIMIIRGTGIRKNKDKIKVKKKVNGEVIHNNIVQVNLKILKEGSKPIPEVKAKETK